MALKNEQKRAQIFYCKFCDYTSSNKKEGPRARAGWQSTPVYFGLQKQSILGSCAKRSISNFAWTDPFLICAVPLQITRK